jgi:hypothetical protein
MSGKLAQHSSTQMNRTVDRTLAVSRPAMYGCDHGNASVDFMLIARRKLPTEVTSVTDPGKLYDVNDAIGRIRRAHVLDAPEPCAQWPVPDLFRKRDIDLPSDQRKRQEENGDL